MTLTPGYVAGLPDVMIVFNRTSLFIELKAPKGGPTPSQRLVMERMRECGAQVAVAKSLQEAIVTLECWGIIKRDIGQREAAE